VRAFFNSRFWTIIELLLLLVAASLVARQLTPLVGVEAGVAGAALQKSPPDWGTLAIVEGKSHAIKWGILLAIAWLLARMRGYRLTRPLGDHGPSLSVGQLILFGLAIAIPLYLIAILPRWYHFEVSPIGETPPIWDLIYNSEWTLDFWIFMAVGSFALIPIVEELFFRGYFLGNLSRIFSASGAILISAAVFALVHLQYVSADLFALYNLAAVFLGAAVYAWSVYFTRSLIPAITGHAFGNLPRPLEWAQYEIGLLALSAVILIWLVPKAIKLQRTL